MEPKDECREGELKGGGYGRYMWRGAYKEQLINPSWRVIFDGTLTTPHFNSEGAARAYLAMLIKGERKPEYTGVK